MEASNIASETTRDLKKRYRDAYLVAKVTVNFGNLIKIIGIVLACVIVVGALSMSSQARGGAEGIIVVGGIIVAGLIGLVFYLLGVLVAAQGQVLQASLDTAVNTSPLLTNADKVEMIGLPTQELEARDPESPTAQNRFVTFDCPQCGRTIHQRVTQCMFCQTALTDEAIETAIAAYKPRRGGGSLDPRRW